MLNPTCDKSEMNYFSYVRRISHILGITLLFKNIHLQLYLIAVQFPSADSNLQRAILNR